MKLIFEPTVYLIGKQQVVEEELKRFLEDEDIKDWTTDALSPAEKLVEVSGRLCYMSFSKPRPGGNAKYIEHIKEVGHGSVTEHTSWTFLITGVSRSLTHELVRHRHFQFAQLSQRYVDETECNMVVPPELQNEVLFFQSCTNDGRIPLEKEFNSPLYKCGENWVDSVQNDLDNYKFQTDYLFSKLVPQEWFKTFASDGKAVTKNVDEMLKELPLEKRTELRKRARQTARSVLPNATESKIVITVNARSLRNFLELRANSHAESEIRVLANKIYDIIVKESPSLFNDYEKIPLEDGSYELKTQNKKI